MKDKKPFINVTEKGHNFTMKDCEFHGDRPMLNTAASNTRVIRTKHFISQKIKEYPTRTFVIVVLATIIAGVILLWIEGKFFV